MTGWFVLGMVSSLRSGPLIVESAFESGLRSTADDYSEENEDDDYRYNNARIALRQENGEALEQSFLTAYSRKEYNQNSQLSNRTRVHKVNQKYTATVQLGRSLAWDYLFSYRDKIYPEKEVNSYEQIIFQPRLTYQSPRLPYAQVFGGVNNYLYKSRGVQDEFLIFGGVSLRAEVWEKKLSWSSQGEVQTKTRDKEQQRRFKEAWQSEARFLPWRSWKGSISALGGWEQRNSKEEDRDEDSDYIRLDAGFKFDAPLTERLSTFIKYNYVHKDYVESNLDFSARSAQNGWETLLFHDRSQRLVLNLTGETKEVLFPLRSQGNYSKQTAAASLYFRARANWGAKFGLNGEFYNYANGDKNKERWSALLSGDQRLGQSQWRLAGAARYRYSDRQTESNLHQFSLRLEVSCKM